MNLYSSIELHAAPLPFRVIGEELQVCLPKEALTLVKFRKLTFRRSFEAIAEQIAEEDLGLEGTAEFEIDRLQLTQSDSRKMTYILIFGVRVQAESEVTNKKFAWMTLEDAKAIHKEQVAEWLYILPIKVFPLKDTGDTMLLASEES